MASWPSGKARVCKTLIMGSNPIDASLILACGSQILFGDPQGFFYWAMTPASA
jgi:hypothetical protein